MSDNERGLVSDVALKELVDRIVEVADPVKIVLFGSVARGQARGDSDADLLVIVRPGVHRRKLAQEIYRRLYGLAQPADVVVVTTEDVERYGDSSALIIEPALEEGKVLYAA